MISIAMHKDASLSTASSGAVVSSASSDACLQLVDMRSLSDPENTSHVSLIFLGIPRSARKSPRLVRLGIDNAVCAPDATVLHYVVCALFSSQLLTLLHNRLV